MGGFAVGAGGEAGMAAEETIEVRGIAPALFDPGSDADRSNVRRTRRLLLTPPRRLEWVEAFEPLPGGTALPT